MKYDLKAPTKDEEAYEVFNLGWTELAQELESLRKHCSDNKNPEYNIDEVIITPVESRDKITIELTEDQARAVEYALTAAIAHEDGMSPQEKSFVSRVISKLHKQRFGNTGKNYNRILAKAKTSAT